MVAQVNFFFLPSQKEGAKFLKQSDQERTEFDLEMIRELGYCSGRAKIIHAYY